MATAPTDPSEPQKNQFDYAWKWFNFHADQRMKMFNYMLVVFGIFAAGIVNALDKQVPARAIAILCFIASALAAIFALLDRRNRDLVWLGEDVLMHLEQKQIFGDDVKIDGRYEEKVPFGILWRQALQERSATARIRSALRDKACAPLVIGIRDAWHGKHRVWLPFLSCSIAVLFLIAGILIWHWGPLFPAPKH